MEDEKYPKQFSSIQITDIKQVMSFLPSVPVNASRSIYSTDTLKSDPAYVEFLTTLGGSLFAKATTGRQLSLKIQSLTNLSSRKSIINENDSVVNDPPVTQKTVKKKEIIRQRGYSIVPPGTSVPSHKVRPIPEKPDIVIKVFPKDAMEVLMREKRFHVYKMNEQLRQERMRMTMMKATMKHELSLRKQKEAELVQCETNEKLLWLSMGRRDLFSKVPIIVVGGGLAGVNAAHQLISSGFKDVTILEASNRLGGRIHTLRLQDPPTVIEMGAPGIDLPAENKEIYKMATECNLTKESYKDRKFNWTIYGVNNVETSSRAARLNNLIEKDMYIVSQLMTDNNSTINLPLDSYIAERHRRLDKNITGDPQSKKDILHAIQCLIDSHRCNIGDSVGDLAVQFRTAPISKCKHIFPEGFSNLIHALSGNFRPHTVRYNCQVTTVKWNYVDRQKGQSDVRVTCTNGQTFWAAHVILAVPLGHLKEHFHKMFHPKLPPAKIAAIKKIGCGTISKAFLLFSSSLDAINLVYSNPTSVFQTTIYIRNLNTNILEITAVGNTLEVLSEETLAMEITSIMRKIVGKYFPDPVKVYKTSWLEDPLYRGTHPYLTTKSDIQNINELAEPVYSPTGKPLLLFAGDYTHKILDCLAEAAFCSGIREACRLENIYDKYFGCENVNE